MKIHTIKGPTQKNVLRSLFSPSGDGHSDYCFARSIDDKAYLRPGRNVSAIALIVIHWYWLVKHRYIILCLFAQGRVKVLGLLEKHEYKHHQLKKSQENYPNMTGLKEASI